jgi:hypothetical protein
MDAGGDAVRATVRPYDSAAQMMISAWPPRMMRSGFWCTGMVRLRLGFPGHGIGGPGERQAERHDH